MSVPAGLRAADTVTYLSAALPPTYEGTTVPTSVLTQYANDPVVNGFMYAVWAQTQNDSVRLITVTASMSVGFTAGSDMAPIALNLNVLVQGFEDLTGYAFFGDYGPIAMFSGVLGGTLAAGWIDEVSILRDFSNAEITSAIQVNDFIHLNFTAMVSND